MKKLDKICKKLINGEAVRYLFFGVMTTVVNFSSYIVCDFLIGKEYYLISNLFSFFAATLFAFITNKKYVFRSNKWDWRTVTKEIISFVSARIGTFLIIEETGLWIFVSISNIERIQWFFFDGVLMTKIFLAFVAVVANYVLSRNVIFKEQN